jgi:hypothetical protein
MQTAISAEQREQLGAAAAARRQRPAAIRTRNNMVDPVLPQLTCSALCSRSKSEVGVVADMALPLCERV